MFGDALFGGVVNDRMETLKMDIARMRSAMRITVLGVAAIMVTAAAAHNAMPKGDAERGARIYEASCTGCHSLDRNRIGPAHRGVVGRKAGTAKDYNYSPALGAADFTWDAAKLGTWLTNPQAMVQGTKMGFRLGDPQRRADIIAFLERESLPQK